MDQPTVNTPRLRLVDAKPIPYEGATYIMLRDPLELTAKTLLVPQPMIPALVLCDGNHTPASIRSIMAAQYGLNVSVQHLDEFLAALDDALLLENDRSRHARTVALAQYRQQPFRTPANAGLSYPDDADALHQLLQDSINHLNGQSQPLHTPIRGIVSPHIDYERGSMVYAQVWNRAAESVREAELAIIFGTDHFSEGFPFSLTRQNYATPFGVLPTDIKIVDQLANALGSEKAFAGELHHRSEHSIELAAVWMHHMRGGAPISVVPILTGSLDHAEETLGKGTLESFLDILQRKIRGRRTIVVAAGDLSHVGPAFDGDPVDEKHLSQIRQDDEILMDAMLNGSAEDFQTAIQLNHDRNNVCGISPIYLTLKLLSPLHGQKQGYAVCPADTAQTSVVTICGVTLH
jgi:AmmeMemoRadiSam system protein B